MMTNPSNAVLVLWTTKTTRLKKAARLTMFRVMGNFSLGGNVRSGPGTQYDKTDRLPFGEPVSLVSRSGVELDGYEWFEIEYSEGLRGYQWGGYFMFKRRCILLAFMNARRS